MFEHFRPGGSPAWDLAWQSSAFLILGGAACAALARRPARAHRVLVLAMLAGLVTPVLCQAVRGLGWGLLASRGELTAPGGAEAGVAARPPLAVDPGPASGMIWPLARPESAAIAGREWVEAPRPAAVEPARLRSSPFPWTRVAAGAWAALAAALLARLGLGLGLGLRLVVRARPIEDRAIRDAAGAARRRLGLDVEPRVLESDQVRCPVVWCWCRRPVLLVPRLARDEAGTLDWQAVWTHELAHWSRRDHLASLLGEVVACLLPWNPLAWWARARLGDLSELACDDWVIASGQSAADYAESLLGLVPQARGGLALAAVSSRISLAARLRRILDDRRRVPAAGPAWTALAIAATGLAAAMTALAQAPAQPPATGAEAPARPKDQASAAKAHAPSHAVRGIVLGPDGKPAAGAKIDWMGFRRTVPHAAVLPKAMQDQDSMRLATIARATTGADGRFAVTAEFAPEEFPGTILVVRAPGAGLSGRQILEEPAGDRAKRQELTFRLRPAATIEGRLLTPAGTPAAGVRVALEDFNNGSSDPLDQEVVSMWFMRDRDDDRPDFWPKPMTTDQDGRFQLAGVVPEKIFAKLRFRHPDFADDEVTVSTGLAVTDTLRSFHIEPIDTPFTHTLAPARPVEGVVTDRETGRPLAGVDIQMIPFRKGRGMQVRTRTDAQGRYRLAGQLGDSYWATAFPPPDSGHIPLEQRHEGWPAGAKSLEMNFALARGRILRGRVVEAGTGRPIAGASVVYRPSRGNPHNRGRYEFRSPVLTGADGAFAITGLPGPGLLAVEGPSPGYIREPVTDPATGKPTNAYPHGFARIDVPGEGEAPETRLALRKGVTLEAVAVGPEGEPLDRVSAWCAELMAKQLDNWKSPDVVPGDGFRLEGVDPDRSYRVFFVHPGRGLGAVAELKYNPAHPVEVRLERAATAKGTVVDRRGRPIQGAQILPYIVLTREEGELKPNDLLSNDGQATVSTMFTHEPLLQVYPPEFAYDTLIPGVRYYVGVYRDGWSFHAIPVLKPGEVRDLGRITHEPEDR
jgi:beta-lactamase regulating signal transducer with metallopeptidase domain